ncbi:MAG: hypothetical protein FWE02_05300 [Defluviitaleaceae bacterium]|nr:hypothetical protein [Defluviitaleaceae bacterium]
MAGKEYLVRGAVLECSCGSHSRKLNLPKGNKKKIAFNCGFCFFGKRNSGNSS